MLDTALKSFASIAPLDIVSRPVFPLRLSMTVRDDEYGRESLNFRKLWEMKVTNLETRVRKLYLKPILAIWYVFSLSQQMGLTALP